MVAGVGLLVVLLVVLLVGDDAVAAWAFELSLPLEFELLLELELDCELEFEFELELEFELSLELELELATLPGLLLVPVRKTEKAFDPPPWKNGQPEHQHRASFRRRTYTYRFRNRCMGSCSSNPKSCYLPVAVDPHNSNLSLE